MKKIIISIFLIILIIFAWSKILDIKAKDYNLQTTKDVATTLAITRSINSALSIVQNSSLLLGVGVQIDLAIGEVVNPLNDFLDRFSWVLLFSLISLGIQDLIMVIAQTPFINSLLTISIVLFTFSLFKENIYKNYIYKFMIFLIFIRFAIPVIEVLNGYIYDSMMQRQILTIQKSNEKFNKEIHELIPTNNAKLNILKQNLKNLEIQKEKILAESTKNLTYFDKLKVKLNYNNSNISKENLIRLKKIDNDIQDLKQKIDKLDINPMDKMNILIKTVKHNMDKFFNESYTTIILFLSRGIIFPLLFLWILLRLGQNILKEQNELFVENGKIS